MARVTNAINYSLFKKTGSFLTYQSASLDIVKLVTWSLRFILDISYWTCWLYKFMLCSWWLCYQNLLMVWNSNKDIMNVIRDLTARCNSYLKKLISKQYEILFKKWERKLFVLNAAVTWWPLLTSVSILGIYTDMITQWFLHQWKSNLSLSNCSLG